ncbi:DUF945 family protein [Duganella sacchari]|nr:DUF945 family protein [Duganella sacchari]
MKKTALAFAMTSAMLVIPVYAADPAATPAPPQLPEFLTPATLETLKQASQELTAATGSERNVAKIWEKYASFEFSPALRPKLKEMFGAERPFPITRTDGPKGQINYIGKLAPYLYVQGNGTDFNWSEMTLKLSTEKTGRSLTMDMQWPSLVMARPDLSVSLENMTLVAKQQRAADGVDYGVANFGVGLVSVRDVTVGDKDAKKLMRFEGITARSETSRRGNNVEIAYRSTVNAMAIGDERVDHANFAFRLTNVPVKVMADFSRSMREQNAQKLDPKAQQELMLKNMKDLGKRALQSGAVLLIDDISVGYRGNVAAIKGRVSFAKTVDADFQDIKAIMKKIVAHFEVRVPVALIRDVGRAISARSVDASAADAARQIDAGADAMVSFVVGKAVSSGFAVVEKDELRSTIDIKDDKLSINGKSMELPKNLGIKAAPEAKPAPAPETKPNP